ncbi:aminotransferase class I/II-fold pyridoxal phosphate-dependent enzyme [Streptomyces sp. MK7]|uniref:aminotransferase class I/II-fold pyridoxal phosphate-dependent enzyme n=1 Tax=Streptomyces sp. MK7 TaxID=3067635 RepID=UPI0037DA570C
MQRTRGISGVVLALPGIGGLRIRGEACRPQPAIRPRRADHRPRHRRAGHPDRSPDRPGRARVHPVPLRRDPRLQRRSRTSRSYGSPSRRRAARLHGIDYDPDAEVLVTPGGVKGSISVACQALLDPGDEVVVPVPDWPHHADMCGRMTPRPRRPRFGGRRTDRAGAAGSAAGPYQDRHAGRLHQPAGKVYSTEELTALARVLAEHNTRREERGESPVHVLFDTPYEAHVLGECARTSADIDVALADGGRCSMRPWTTWVSGPGKTYGMHGDRTGHPWSRGHREGGRAGAGRPHLVRVDLWPRSPPRRAPAGDGRGGHRQGADRPRPPGGQGAGTGGPSLAADPATPGLLPVRRPLHAPGQPGARGGGRTARKAMARRRCGGYRKRRAQASCGYQRSSTVLPSGSCT